MPLHADGEVPAVAELPALGLDRLDQAVLGPRDRAQIESQPVDRLVVEGVDHHRTPARGLREARVRCHAHFVGRVMRELGLTVLDDSLDEVGHMLVQRALSRHIEHLRASAYAEDGYRPPVGCPAQLELERVDDGVGWAELRVRLGPVAGGVQVGTPGEQQPREMVQHRIDVLHRERRQRNRQAPGHLDRAHVGEPEGHLRLRGLAVQDVLASCL